MKQIKKIFTCCLLVLSLGTVQAQDQLKVITFNIKSFENTGFEVQPFADLLAAENADIICLNEVENRSARQMVNMKYRDVVQDLASKMQLFGVFGYSYNLMNKQGDEEESKYTYCENELYGNAILSRYPILNVETRQLPRPAGSADQRGVVIADILLPSGKTVRVACTHLDHKGGQKEQAQAVVSSVAGSTIPTLVCGDMNQWPGTEVIDNVLSRSFDRLCSDEITYDHGNSKLDYIFGSMGRFELVETKVLNRYYNFTELSDHHPVVSVVKFKN